MQHCSRNSIATVEAVQLQAKGISLFVNQTGNISTMTSALAMDASISGTRIEYPTIHHASAVVFHYLCGDPRRSSSSISPKSR